MVESKEFIVDGKKIKMDTIFKDNKNYVSLQSLKNSGILLVDYNKEMKIPVIASK